MSDLIIRGIPKEQAEVLKVFCRLNGWRYKDLLALIIALMLREDDAFQNLPWPIRRLSRTEIKRILSSG